MDPPGPVPEMPGLSPVKGCVPENGFTAVAQAEAGPSQYHKRKNSAIFSLSEDTSSDHQVFDQKHSFKVQVGQNIQCTVLLGQNN